MGIGTTDELPVLVAVHEPTLEAQVVSLLSGGRTGLLVIRRCVDLADLLAAATTRTAVAAVVSTGLRRFDQEALGRLHAAGLAVVGLNDGSAVDAERNEARVRQLGVEHVVTAGLSSSAENLGSALADAVKRAVQDQAIRARPAPDGVGREPADGPDVLARPKGRRSSSSTATPDADFEAGPANEQGRVIAVWGPTGAPGRSFVAWHLAGEVSAAGRSALVVDADVYGGTLAQYAGLGDEAPGIVAACRAANVGALDVVRLASLCRALPTVENDAAALSVLTGIPRGARWPEVRAAAAVAAVKTARQLADLVLVDCGFAIEEDEDLSYDTLAPRRNGATIAVLAEADEVVVVGSSGPIGLTRLIAGLDELRELLGRLGHHPPIRVVVNRVGGSSRDRRQVKDALLRHAAVSPAALLPLEVNDADRALMAGIPLAAAVPRSPLREPLARLANGLQRGPGADAAAAGQQEVAGARRRRFGSRRTS